jgi:hypothetical protein
MGFRRFRGVVHRLGIPIRSFLVVPSSRDTIAITIGSFTGSRSHHPAILDQLVERPQGDAVPEADLFQKPVLVHGCALGPEIADDGQLAPQHPPLVFQLREPDRLLECLDFVPQTLDPAPILGRDSFWVSHFASQ